MYKLYNFFIKNSKLIMAFVLVVLIHFFLINNLQSRASKVSSQYDLQKNHQLIQTKISTKLMNDCKAFTEKLSNRKNSHFETKNGFSFSINQRKITGIKDIEFYQIILESKSKLKAGVNKSTKSFGYLVRLISNNNCYGII